MSFTRLTDREERTTPAYRTPNHNQYCQSQSHQPRSRSKTLWSLRRLPSLTINNQRKHLYQQESRMAQHLTTWTTRRREHLRQIWTRLTTKTPQITTNSWRLSNAKLRVHSKSSLRALVWPMDVSRRVVTHLGASLRTTLLGVVRERKAP